MIISLYPLIFFVWVWIAVRGRRRNLAQGAGSAKTGTAYKAVTTVTEFFKNSYIEIYAKNIPMYVFKMLTQELRLRMQ